MEIASHMGSPGNLALIVDSVLLQHVQPRPEAGAPIDVLEPAPKLTVVDIPGKGRGVVAGKDIARGEVIERAPVIPVDPAQVAALCATVLDHYVYDWFPGSTGLAVALGFGSLYNHSYQPNAYYKKDFANNVLEYVALTDIAAGSEIVINYNGVPDDRTPLWFDVVA